MLQSNSHNNSLKNVFIVLVLLNYTNYILRVDNLTIRRFTGSIFTPALDIFGKYDVLGFLFVNA